ncbi:hypothetical protein [Burkholderia pseudomallei]|uniref:hypothetical protein n=1 Tax=Burkholderia pseudomallei TaxID=28450 RepID=UPI001AB01430|nr:hypothetical protein [Burkholderia pseudomallei]MBO2961544.1 hypothetical protein [Burkholderia pseudomallei]MBO7835346.1 hypothetical protein [Burkholderia pseudomallei]MBO7853465.1 hypothetical protein [Burkholderia pseudomallei]
MSPDHPWNSLEIVKLAAEVLTPVSVAGFGWLVSHRLKQLELVQWTNQKLIEKRLALYDTIAPLLNRLLCFYTWVGPWKDISPDDVIRAKRELDQTIHIYRHLFDDDVYRAYQAYLDALFDTHSGAGRDARIKSTIASPDGDRIGNGTYRWNPAWAERFTDANVASRDEVRARYQRIMDGLRISLGVAR